MTLIWDSKLYTKWLVTFAKHQYLWRSRKAFACKLVGLSHCGVVVKHWPANSVVEGSKLLTDYLLAPMTLIWDSKLYTKWLVIILSYVYFMSATVAQSNCGVVVRRWIANSVVKGSRLLTVYLLAPMTLIWDSKLYTKWLDIILSYVDY
ncbi:hypothetical protein OUZ56_010627 [Daphnia magna]|uniref:Uncharacterized protein n=1 Tax=Daphnia magna TaxID=35525 RepID=A0ABR0AJ34_9CRUS|nr:hypothetical protein OUZ56_010627 [Daphnia magna]